MASSSRMTVATMMFVTSAPSSAPALGPAVKAEDQLRDRGRSPFWQVSADICAPPAKGISAANAGIQRLKQRPRGQRGLFIFAGPVAVQVGQTVALYKTQEDWRGAYR